MIRFIDGTSGACVAFRSVMVVMACLILACFVGVPFAAANGFRTLFVPREDAAEAALIPDVSIIPVGSLAELVSHLHGIDLLPPQPATPFDAIETQAARTDFRDIKGQEHVKRAMEVAAAGGHNVIMSGPPGAGKTLIARALPGIIPPLTVGEALDVTQIYSVAGVLPPDTPMVRERPFRAPHHTISHAGLSAAERCRVPARSR